MKGDQAASPASVSVSLSDQREVSVLLENLRGSLRGKADSVRITVRGTKSVVVDLLNRFADEIDVSANVTVKGDTPTLES